MQYLINYTSITLLWSKVEASEIIPMEYSHIYKEINDQQRQSFEHSFQISDQETHHYERLAEALERTLDVYQEPDPYLFLFLSRVSFVCTRYNALDGYYNKVDKKYKKYIAPFLGRVRAFQNEYEEAIKLALSALEELEMEIEPKLIDVILFFEANFTLGLAYAYTRQFDKANEVISTLEGASSKFMYKKLIGEKHMLDYVFIENIIKGYTMFFSGNPKGMADVLNNMREWTHTINDPWLEGFYYNIYGISRMMFQELSEGERAMRVAFKKFEVVHDLRGYSTVGANLGLSLITKGKRDEGRKYLEAVISPLISMKNYWLAVGNMLELAKSYMEEKKEEDARKMLDEAEEISANHDVGDPNIYSMFSFFYSRIGELEKANDYLKKLEVIKSQNEDDQYTNLYYYMASSVTLMHTGNLQQANLDIVQGIEIADQANYFNYALELSMVHLEIILKRYLIEQKSEYIRCCK